MIEFKYGQKIQIDPGGEATIISKLGEGGQGIVYKVEFAGKCYALKWYKRNKIKDAEKFRLNLENNIKDKSVSKNFLWPLYITKGLQYDSFGYIMDLKPKEYSDFKDILNAKVTFSSLNAIVNATLNIVTSFRDLHRAGKSYQDLNDGGFFINTKTGDILICDCDNVAPYGENVGIAGKPGYMAPEIVRGESTPNMQTDKFSLAVILFKLLFRGDPLEGEKVIKSVCLTEKAERKHYGLEPIFVYDPQNTSNRPVRGVHNNVIKFWNIFPQYIKDAFITSFTKGINNPDERLIENQWFKYFVKLRSEIITCNCGFQNFVSGFLSDDDGKIHCLKCNRIYTNPLLLNIKKMPVVLFPGNKLYECHTKSLSDDYTTITGEVIQNKIKKGLFGIKNLSDSTWTATLPNGKTLTVGKNSVVPILIDTCINFGNDNEGNIITRDN